MILIAFPNCVVIAKSLIYMLVTRPNQFTLPKKKLIMIIITRVRFVFLLSAEAGKRQEYTAQLHSL